MPSSGPILCFGEILWDFLPQGLFPGGAPFNVGYHLQKLGQRVELLSGIGRDKLGGELVRRLNSWDISTECITFHAGLPTGTVIADTSPNGDATYTITPSVAWDQILMSEDVTRRAVEAAGLVFGSLALRSPVNRSSLDRLLKLVPADAWRVFDVNLRPPHDDLDLVRDMTGHASLLKLNAEEAARIVLNSDAEEPGAEEAMARALAKDKDIRVVCITAAERGAGLLMDDVWHWEPGRSVNLVNTVGAGDAFLARLLAHLIAEDCAPAEALASACRHGEWVATQYGATPDY